MKFITLPGLLALLAATSTSATPVAAAPFTLPRLYESFQHLLLDSQDIIHVPPERIECDTTLQKYNRPAELRPLEQYLLHWLLWNNLPWDRFPKDNGNVDLVDCCENSAIWIAARNVTKWTPVNAREVAVMMSAVGNHCRQGARAKGRAWDPERIFTVEIGQEDCRRKCRH